MTASVDIEKLAIRHADIDDAKILWEWANDPAVRGNSFNNQAIPWESHLSWLEKVLSSPGTRLWILSVDNIPAGQIRYDRDDERTAAQISFSIAQPFRAQGLAAKIISMTVRPAMTDLGVGEIIAYVLDGNLPSSRAFIRAGFAEEESLIRDGIKCSRYRYPRNQFQGRPSIS